MINYSITSDHYVHNTNICIIMDCLPRPRVKTQYNVRRCSRTVFYTNNNIVYVYVGTRLFCMSNTREFIYLIVGLYIRLLHYCGYYTVCVISFQTTLLVDSETFGEKNYSAGIRSRSFLRALNFNRHEIFVCN